jgi:hypothetical protein
MSFFTRRRTFILLVVFAVAFLVWFAILRAGEPPDTSSRSGANEAGYNVGYWIAAPLVLAIITTTPVLLIWRWRVRRSH